MRAIWIKAGVVLAIIVGLGLGHAALLRTLARPLVADESQEGSALVCLQGGEYGVEGDPTLDEPARWCREDPARRILLLEPWPHRAVELGIVPSFEQMVRRELARRGVHDAAITTIAGSARDCWEEAGLLGTWLGQHPGEEMTLVCGRFNSGQVRRILDSVLGRQEAARVRIRALADPDYDETNWWRSRRGVKGFMFGWLGLAYAWGEGKDRIAPPRWSVQEYQSLLDETYGKAP